MARFAWIGRSLIAGVVIARRSGWVLAAGVAVFAIYLWDIAGGLLRVDSGRLALAAQEAIAADRPDAAVVLASKALPQAGLQIQPSRKWRWEPERALFEALDADTGLRRYSWRIERNYSRGGVVADSVLAINQSGAKVNVVYGRRGIERIAEMQGPYVITHDESTGRPIDFKRLTNADEGAGQDSQPFGSEIISIGAGGALVGVTRTQRSLPPIAGTASIARPIYQVETCIYDTRQARFVGGTELRASASPTKIYVGGNEESAVVFAYSARGGLQAARARLGESAPANCVSGDAHGVGAQMAELKSGTVAEGVSLAAFLEAPGDQAIDESSAKFDWRLTERRWGNGAIFAASADMSTLVTLTEGEDREVVVKVLRVGIDGALEEFELPKPTPQEGEAEIDPSSWSPTAAAADADGGRLAVGHMNGATRIYCAPWSAHATCKNLERGPDGDRDIKVYVTVDPRILESGSLVEGYGPRSDLRAVTAISFSANRLAISNVDIAGPITSVYKIEDGLEFERSLAQESWPATRLVLAPGGQSIAIEGRDGSLEIWDIDTGALSHKIGSRLRSFDDFGSRGVAWNEDGGAISFITGKGEAFVLRERDFVARLSAPITALPPMEDTPYSSSRGVILAMRPSGDAGQPLFVSSLQLKGRIEPDQKPEFVTAPPIGVDPLTGAIVRRLNFGEAPSNDGDIRVARDLFILKDENGRDNILVAVSLVLKGGWIASFGEDERLDFWNIADGSDTPYLSSAISFDSLIVAEKDGHGLMVTSPTGDASIFRLSDYSPLRAKEPLERAPDYPAVCAENSGDEGKPVKFAALGERQRRDGWLKWFKGDEFTLDAVFVCADRSVVVARGSFDSTETAKALHVTDRRNADRYIIPGESHGSQSTVSDGWAASAFAFAYLPAREEVMIVEQESAAKDRIELVSLNPDTIERWALVGLSDKEADASPGVPRESIGVIQIQETTAGDGVYLVSRDQSVRFVSFKEIDSKRDTRSSTQNTSSGAIQTGSTRGLLRPVVAEQISNYFSAPPWNNDALPLLHDDFGSCSDDSDSEGRLMLLAGELDLILATRDGKQVLKEASRSFGFERAPMRYMPNSTVYVPPSKNGARGVIATALTSNEIKFESLPARKCRSDAALRDPLLSYRRNLTLAERAKYEVEPYSDFSVWLLDRACAAAGLVVKLVAGPADEWEPGASHGRCERLESQISTLRRRKAGDDEGVKAP